MVTVRGVAARVPPPDAFSGAVLSDPSVAPGSAAKSSGGLTAGLPDVFGDFLEMANQLLNDGYVLAAAVVAGSALEGQLRAIAERVGVSTHARGKPKRAGMLNDDLAKKDVLQQAEQKQVTAWQDLRNSAAHGHDDFTAPEIRLMIQGIRDIVARHPA